MRRNSGDVGSMPSLDDDGKLGGKTRSPNFPFLSLPKVIEGVETIYSKVQRRPAPDESLVTLLGYGSLNGTSRKVMSAYRKYGALEEASGGSRISDDAYTVVELGVTSPDGFAAAERMAKRPSIMATLFERYEAALPNEASFRHYLVTSNSFQPEGAALLYRVFKETREFLEDARLRVARNQPSAPVPKDEFATSNPSPAIGKSSAPGGTSSAADGMTIRSYTSVPVNLQDTLRVRIYRDLSAVVQFEGDAKVTQEAIRKLMALLDLQIDSFPTAAEIAAQEAELREATSRSNTPLLPGHSGLNPVDLDEGDYMEEEE